MPLGTIRTYLRLLPKLRAEESIEAANRMAMGAGGLSAEAKSDLAREWEATAMETDVAMPPMTKGPRTTESFLGPGVGVAYVTVKPKPAEESSAHGG